MPNITQIEKYLQRKQALRLKILLEQRGYDINLYERETDQYSETYGFPANNRKVSIKKVIKGITVSDDFVPVSDLDSGLFIEGFLYSDDEEVVVGDIIGIPRPNSRERLYKVVGEEVIGTTDRVGFKYRLSSIEER